MRCGIERVRRGVIPLYGQRRAAFDRCPCCVGDHRDPFRNFYDGADAMNRACFLFLHAFRFRTGERRALERSVEHARNFDINAVTRLAAHDVAAVNARGALTDNFIIAWVFQRRMFRQRQPRGVGDQIAIAKPAAAGRVNDEAVRSRARRAIHFPTRRRCHGEHLTGSRSGPAQRSPAVSDAIAAACSDIFETRSG